MNGFQAIPGATPLLACPWSGITSSSRDGKKSSFPPPNKFLPPQVRRVSVSSSSRSRGFSSLGVNCASHNTGTQPYAEEPTTGVKFVTSVMVHGRPGFLALLGTGNREKVSAIIGVKVSVSSDGWPTAVDAEIDSENVTFSIFDMFIGAAPASPFLKASAASGLAATLK